MTRKEEFTMMYDSFLTIVTKYSQSIDNMDDYKKMMGIFLSSNYSSFFCKKMIDVCLGKER